MPAGYNTDIYTIQDTIHIIQYKIIYSLNVTIQLSTLVGRPYFHYNSLVKNKSEKYCHTCFLNICNK